MKLLTSSFSPARLAILGLAGASAMLSSSCKPKADWQAFNAAGMKLDVPGPLEDSKMAMPAGVAPLANEFKLWQGKGGGCQVSISHAFYKIPANLQGAADGAIEGIKGTLHDLQVKDSTSLKIAGKDAIEAHLSFTLNGSDHDGSLFTITDGPRLWQIQVLSLSGSSREIADKMKQSITIEEPAQPEK